MSPNDPYRDSIESRVGRLEQKVEENHSELKGQISDLLNKIKGIRTAPPSIWHSIKSAFYNSTHWSGWSDGGGVAVLAIIGLAATFIFGVPSCVRSCNADNAQAREALVHQREEACEALGLRYAEYWDDPNASRNDYIICVGTDRVVYISPADPTRSYSRTIEQLNSATIPSPSE